MLEGLSAKVDLVRLGGHDMSLGWRIANEVLGPDLSESEA
jgi:hypothetical protein